MGQLAKKKTGKKMASKIHQKKTGRPKKLKNWPKTGKSKKSKNARK